MSWRELPDHSAPDYSDPADSAPALSGPGTIQGEPGSGERFEAGWAGEERGGWAGEKTSAERYERRGLLGIGGMGRVYAAWDRVLRREVALKEAATPELAERLAREARITAQLEHPGIVAVYDAGVLAGEGGPGRPCGRPWYSMRLVRGRTLHERIRECADTAERLALVGRFHDACQAVAYAHAMGVVHRDLKPANIMIGQFGETQVADWGLARPVDEATDWWARIAPGAPRSGAGTERYMSPEQARGAPPSRAADVWSLGVSLRELLGDDPELPPELVAIARRATRTDPADRYPSAAEMAEDLGRWLSGRRVRAHAYTTGELLARLVQAWRAPLAVGGVAAVALIAATIVGARRVAIEQDTAERHLGHALTQQALAALGDDRRPAAEVLAAHALLLGDSPEARGVLAATAGPRPERIRSEPIPELCQRRASLSPDGALLACRDGERLELWEREPLRLRWSLDERLLAGPSWDEGLVIQVENTVQRLSLADGSETARWETLQALTLFPGPIGLTPGWAELMSEGEPTRKIRTCASSRSGAIPYRDMLITGCEDRVVVYDADGTPRDLPLGRPPHWSALAAMDGGVLAGTFEGEVYLFDPESGSSTPPLQGFEGPIVQLQPIPGTPLVAALGERGGPRIWHTGIGAWVATLPGRVRRIFPGGRPGELILLGDALHTWRLPDQLRAAAVEVGAGVSQVTVSPDGEQLAYALGSGEVGLRRVDDGALIQRWHWQGAVAKCVAFWGDDLMASAMDGGARRLSMDGEISPPERTRTLRRAGWLGGGVWGLPYSRGVVFYRGGEILETGAQLFYEGSSSPSGDVAIFLAEEGDAWLFDGEQLTLAVERHDAVAADVGDGGAPIALAERHRVCVDDECLAIEDSVVDIALSSDLLAVATVAGDVLLVELGTMAVAAVLQGHSSRVSSVEFGPGWLVSGSWDGSVRIWDLSVLDADAETLVSEREAAWGMDLDAALDSR